MNPIIETYHVSNNILFSRSLQCIDHVHSGRGIIFIFYGYNKVSLLDQLFTMFKNTESKIKYLLNKNTLYKPIPCCQQHRAKPRHPSI